LKTKSTKENKINVVTLGCSKNLVDSENLIGQLKGNAMQVAHQSKEDDANIVIVNTCGFIDLAKEESISTILNYAEAKKQGEIEKLYVTGCLSQRYKDDLSKEIPEVNSWFGTFDMPFLLKELGADYKHELIGERQGLTTPKHYAYLKISEGCNRTCSFCAIPLMRGKHISKSIEDLVFESQNLAKQGVKELILIAQELTYYGLDIYKKRELPRLLQELSKVEGIEWIRLHYAYPSKFPLEIIEQMKALPKVCNYLDIPLQHASDNVLDAMKRQITLADTKKLIQDIRTILPEITLRTTMLVGFPGETQEDIETLANFIKETRFERLGVFTYSHEEDTSAHNLEDSVSEEEKAERANYIMQIQQEISNEINSTKIGNTYKVIVDRKDGHYFVCRTEADSPEVDNEVLVNAADNYLRVGDFAEIKITDSTDFDLYGETLKA